MHPAISPDGSRLLFIRTATGSADIFVHDFATRQSRRVTPGPDYDEEPRWSPDGTEMVHKSIRGNVTAIMRVRLDGSVPPAELTREPGLLTPVAWSPDGRYVLVTKNVPGSGVDIVAVSTTGTNTVTPLLTGPANEFEAGSKLCHTMPLPPFNDLIVDSCPSECRNLPPWIHFLHLSHRRVASILTRRTRDRR